MGKEILMSDRDDVRRGVNDAVGDVALNGFYFIAFIVCGWFALGGLVLLAGAIGGGGIFLILVVLAGGAGCVSLLRQRHQEKTRARALEREVDQAGDRCQRHKGCSCNWGR